MNSAHALHLVSSYDTKWCKAVWDWVKGPLDFFSWVPSVATHFQVSLPRQDFCYSNANKPCLLTLVDSMRLIECMSLTDCGHSLVGDQLSIWIKSALMRSPCEHHCVFVSNLCFVFLVELKSIVDTFQMFHYVKKVEGSFASRLTMNGHFFIFYKRLKTTLTMIRVTII